MIVGATFPGGPGGRITSALLVVVQLGQRRLILVVSF